MNWQLQEAKQRFSEVVRSALAEGPQIVTRHGKDTVVVLSLGDFDRLRGEGKDFKAFLRHAPDLEALAIEREKRPTRRVRL